jgi:putative transposase
MDPTFDTPAGGPPPIDQQIRVLVREMATANPLWGAPRIHGELRTLGVDVAERTVSRLLGRYPRPPSQTWKTFLTNHLASAASMDFFIVPTLMGRVLFVFIVLAHHRRRIVPFNITDHPTDTWSAQQVAMLFRTTRRRREDVVFGRMKTDAPVKPMKKVVD